MEKITIINAFFRTVYKTDQTKRQMALSNCFVKTITY